MVAAATIAAVRAGWAGRSRVVSSTSAALAETAPVVVASPCLRPARSAVVVSVVSAAATRWVWRFVDAAAAARLRAAGVAVAEVRAVRAAFAASPRTAAALDEAARDAAVRFDGAGTCVCVSSSEADADAAEVPFGVRFAAPLAVPFAAPALPVSAVFVVFVVFVVFAVLGAFDVASASVAGFARAGVVRVDAGRFGAAPSPKDPLSADTPVPVPSGASSSCSERETEVTQTTYQ